MERSIIEYLHGYRNLRGCLSVIPECSAGATFNFAMGCGYESLCMLSSVLLWLVVYQRAPQNHCSVDIILLISLFFPQTLMHL